jgi:phytoene dehydrogenase-like protein
MTKDRHMKTTSEDIEVVIVGAGLAGLACAQTLHATGKSFTLCEAGDRVGGRVATEVIDGYRLDRGFQVLLTAYPHAQQLLDYQALDLRRFYPGALVRHGGRWHRLADPFRRPLDGVMSVGNDIGSFADKVRLGWLRLGGFHFADTDQSSLAALQARGFSPAMIERFFRPFLGGVFLEGKLETTVRKLEFVMRNFARGDTAIPALGMAEIPRQLAARLPQQSIRLNTRVASVDGNTVHLEGGATISSRGVIIATDQGAAMRLLGQREAQATATVVGNSVTCLYFTATSASLHEPILLLNGEGAGPINNLAVLSAVSPDYAPPGQHLISISVVDQRAAHAEDLEDQVRRQLHEWFGAATTAWKCLRVVHVPLAVPAQLVAEDKPARVRTGIYQCGDHCGIASIETALASGVTAAKAFMEDLS